MKHPADGLYYATYEMLDKNGACQRALDQWERLYGYAAVPLTLEVVLSMEDDGTKLFRNSASAWAMYELIHRRKISIDMWHVFEKAYNGDPVEVAIMFMDALKTRHDKEHGV